MTKMAGTIKMNLAEENRKITPEAIKAAEGYRSILILPDLDLAGLENFLNATTAKRILHAIGWKIGKPSP